MRTKSKFKKKSIKVKVDFIENLSSHQIVDLIRKLNNPQIIFWYIGCSGLKEKSLNFYKDFFISKIYFKNYKSFFWLVDLTAWGAFKNRNLSITNFNSITNVFTSNLRIKFIRSSEIFKKISEVVDLEEINYIKSILRKNFIYKASEAFQRNNIQVKSLFSKNCQCVEEVFCEDTAKAYSAFQYLEGCLIVEKVFLFNNKINMSKIIEIVFVLPNDELKYYKDKKRNFRKDCEFFIRKKIALLNLKECEVNIRFISFKYGLEMCHRPYNANGTVIKKTQFDVKDIIGIDSINGGKKYE